tara:strand:+ start:9712 stop:9921 length:210 start_codon:yes stop_codon:yes gene_type:complete
MILKKDYEEMTKALVNELKRIDPKGHYMNCTGNLHYNTHRQFVVDRVRRIMESYGLDCRVQRPVWKGWE